MCVGEKESGVCVCVCVCVCEREREEKGEQVSNGYTCRYSSNWLLYAVANGPSTESDEYSPHVLRSEKDELFVQIVSRMVQHQLHTDSTIHHILHI